MMEEMMKKRCIVVLDNHGDYHAAVMKPFQTSMGAARALVQDVIPFDPREFFQYTVVEDCDDPGKARLLGQGKTALGSFRMGPS
jgi:hypothetical protein